MVLRFQRLAAATVAVAAIAVGSAVVANAASSGNTAGASGAEVQAPAPSATDIAPVQQPAPGPGRPPCHRHDGGSGSNDSGSDGSSPGGSAGGSSSQI